MSDRIPYIDVRNCTLEVLWCCFITVHYMSCCKKSQKKSFLVGDLPFSCLHTPKSWEIYYLFLNAPQKWFCQAFKVPKFLHKLILVVVEIFPFVNSLKLCKQSCRIPIVWKLPFCNAGKYAERYHYEVLCEYPIACHFLAKYVVTRCWNMCRRHCTRSAGCAQGRAQGRAQPGRALRASRVHGVDETSNCGAQHVGRSNHQTDLTL